MPERPHDEGEETGRRRLTPGAPSERRMSEWLLLSAAGLAGLSGAPGLFLPRASNAGQRIAAGLMGAASAFGIWAALRVFLLGPGEGLVARSTISGAAAYLLIDELSAAFLLPVFLIAGLGAVFDLEYWKQSRNPRNGRKLRLFYGLLTAGLALLVSARNGALFLAAWELMAISAFFAMTTEDEKAEVREAGWVYFTATHLSTLFLFAFFALSYSATGTMDLIPFPPGSIPPGLADALFILALLGFGLKAGVFPLHFWLPPAHANAPSHVSALMSGVLIKMGVYGVLRASWLLPEPPAWWGELLLGLGAVSGILGVAFALGQHDLKRLLAYHSIENIGIIFMGMGLALLGRSLGRADLVSLGLAGAILHTWNHGLFKALLFLAAGSAIHASHTRRIDLLGGLARTMPLTAFFFLIGAVAICGLPPLNGFVSELLLYIGLFRAWCSDGPASWNLASFAIPALALMGALALACFVKVFGTVFLGLPRGEQAVRAREPGRAMLAPMGVLVAFCLLIGCSPSLVAPLLDAAVRNWTPLAAGAPPALSSLAPLGGIGLAAVSLLGALALSGLLLRRAPSEPARERGPTWDCGYAGGSPSIQYTASSFAQMLVGLLRWALWPRKEAPLLEGPFPARASFHSSVPDGVLDRGIVPALRAVGTACTWLRLLQRGRINAYLLYIFLALLVLLLC